MLSCYFYWNDVFHCSFMVGVLVVFVVVGG